MKFKILLLISIVPAMLIGCRSTPCADVLIRKNTTDTLERKNNLFVFVGERIDMNRFPTREADGYTIVSRYKIIQRVYGCYPRDTIVFTTYTFRDWPEFSRFKNVLLYVTEENGQYEHKAHLYDDVYMTQSGKWAGPFEAEDSDHYSELNIIPQRVEFTDSIVFPLDPVHKDDYLQKSDYPHPFYWTIDYMAVAHYGIDVENLFSVKKNKSLGRMGLFTEPTKYVQLEVQDVELEEVFPESIPENNRFKDFWKQFAQWVVQYDTTHIKQHISDSLWVCGSLFTKQKLMSGCFREIANRHLFQANNYSEYFNFTPVDIALNDLIPSARKQIIKEKEGFRLKQIELDITDDDGNLVSDLFFSFIKTKNGYRLYDIRYTLNRSCCY